MNEIVKNREILFTKMFLDENISVLDMCIKFGNTNYYRLKKKLGLSVKVINISETISKQELERLYITEQKSISKIAKIFNVGNSTISHLLKENNIKTRKSTNKYFTNHNYFNQLNIIGARILGLLASDGSLRSGKYRNIVFYSNDIELCEFIKNNLGGGIYSKNKKLYYNQITSEIIINYLNKIGITSNKSKTLEIDFSIFNTEELKYAFLIGMLEGDGHIGYYNYNAIITQITLATGSDKFKEQIMKYYPEFTYSKLESYHSNKSTSYTHVISCSTHKNQLLLINKLLPIIEQCGMLDRKYQDLLKIKQYLVERV